MRAALGINRRTLDRWEDGTLPVGPDDLRALLRLCMEHGDRLNEVIRRIELALREEG